MTIANFKARVAAIVNRDATLFVVGGVDNLLQAMNDARRWAQRSHDFELLRTEDAYLSTSVAGANWATGCKTTPGGATAQLMKRVDEVWMYGTTTVGATTTYPRTYRIPFSYTGQFKRDLPVAQQYLWPIPNVYTQFDPNQFAYSVGTTLYVVNTSSATIFKLLGIKFLDDLTGTEDPDIFLTYYTDWFTYATIAALNYYLKDGERFVVDQGLVDNLWKSVIQHDGTIANMGESVNLD